MALGGLVARLPLPLSLAAVVGALLVAAAVWEPVLGLGLAMVLGPARAFLGVARPDLPADLGQLFFGLALAGWLARGLLQRQIHWPRSGLWLPLALYAGAGLLSLLPAQSFEEGARELLKWVQIGLGAALVASESERPGRQRLAWVVAAVLAAGALQALVGLWQYELRGNGPDHFRIQGDQFRAYGTFEQPNPYGGFLGLIWPIAAGLAYAQATRVLPGLAARVRRATPLPALAANRRAALATLALAWQPWLLAGLFAACAALVLAGLYVSFSRGAWLGAGAAGVAMAAMLPRRWWMGVALAGLALAAGLALWQAGQLPASIAARLGDVTDLFAVSDVRGVTVTPENFALLERVAHWQAAEAMARDHLWLGVGLGNYAVAYPRYALFNWPNALGHAHMIYLNVLAETGLIGFVSYSALWLAVIALTIRCISALAGVPRGLALGLLGAWVHLSVHQIVDNLYVNNIHLTIAALFGLLICLARLRSPAARLPAGNEADD